MTNRKLACRLLAWVSLLCGAAWILLAVLTPSTGYHRIPISLSTNGTPVLYGISLANTNLRDAVFFSVHVFGGKTALVIPSPVMTNMPIAGLIVTFEAMKRAGIMSP